MSKSVDNQERIELWLTGKKHKVYSYVQGNRNKVLNFFEDLKAKDKDAYATIVKQIEKTADFGYDIIKNTVLIRMINTQPKIPKFEITQFRIRIIFCVYKNNIYLLHPYKKDNKNNTKYEDAQIKKGQNNYQSFIKFIERT